MNLDVALGSMRLISNIGRAGFLDGIGVSKFEFDRFVGDEPWLASDRNRMTNVLHTIVNASLDAIGCPRFSLPVEYVAAGISIFVAPINAHPACLWAPPSPSAESLGRSVACAPCTPEQLFALVVQLYSNPGRTSARALFEKSTGISLDNVMVKSNGGKSK